MTDPAILAVGPRVTALREAEGLSLRDLAERSGVSAPMLSQVERGATSPTLQIAARIASGLRLRLSQLLRLDENGASVSIVPAGHGRTAAPAAIATRCSRHRCPACARRSRATCSRRARPGERLPHLPPSSTRVDDFVRAAGDCTRQ